MSQLSPTQTFSFRSIKKDKEIPKLDLCGTIPCYCYSSFIVQYQARMAPWGKKKEAFVYSTRDLSSIVMIELKYLKHAM